MLGGANGWQGKVGEKDVEKVKESRRSDRGKDALGSENGEQRPMTPQLRNSFTTQH
jgi:hypothetical protein